MEQPGLGLALAWDAGTVATCFAHHATMFASHILASYRCSFFTGAPKSLVHDALGLCIVTRYEKNTIVSEML